MPALFFADFLALIISRSRSASKCFFHVHSELGIEQRFSCFSSFGKQIETHGSGFFCSRDFFFHPLLCCRFLSFFRLLIRLNFFRSFCFPENFISFFLRCYTGIYQSSVYSSLKFLFLLVKNSPFFSGGFFMRFFCKFKGFLLSFIQF